LSQKHVDTDSKEKVWETLIKGNGEMAQSTYKKAEVASFRLNTSHDLLGRHLEILNIMDSHTSASSRNIVIQDRGRLRSYSVLQDKLVQDLKI
jgi:hypothetical protein